jgi:hypothetical protein
VTLYESWIVLTDSRETSLLKPPRPWLTCYWICWNSLILLNNIVLIMNRPISWYHLKFKFIYLWIILLLRHK